MSSVQNSKINWYKLICVDVCVSVSVCDENRLDENGQVRASKNPSGSSK